MKTYNSHNPRVRFTGLILAVVVELALPMMGQVPISVPKIEPAAAVAQPGPLPTPATSAKEDPAAQPAAVHFAIRSFFVDPYQFHEVVRPKLPLSEVNILDGMENVRALHQWFAQLGVEINPTNGMTMFWHDDGRLSVRARSDDLDTIEAAITAMGKEYSGRPHPPLGIYVFYLAPAAFEEGLQKLTLLSGTATNSPANVTAAALRRFAELGVDPSLPKTFYYNRSRGYLALCATRADLEIVEPEVVRLQGTLLPSQDQGRSQRPTLYYPNGKQ